MKWKFLPRRQIEKNPNIYSFEMCEEKRIKSLHHDSISATILL